MKKPEIVYPCQWEYAVMGLDEEDLLLCAGEILRGRPHKVSFSRQSPGKKYTAMHIDVRVESEQDRNEIFEAFKTHAKVKFVL
jgi:putative lipoic acid-binding regulatory protein